MFYYKSGSRDSVNTEGIFQYKRQWKHRGNIPVVEKRKLRGNISIEETGETQRE